MLNFSAMLLRESSGPTCNERPVPLWNLPLMIIYMRTSQNTALGNLIRSAAGCLEGVVSVMVLTINSTVPGGLFFSIFVWLLLLQSSPKDPREKWWLSFQENYIKTSFSCSLCHNLTIKSNIQWKQYKGIPQRKGLSSLHAEAVTDYIDWLLL